MVANLRLDGISTSTIGTFPLEDSETNRKRCIEDLIDIGIDFPAYPQLSDMGKQFLDDLAKQDSGIIATNGKYHLKGKEINGDVSPPGLEPFFWTLRHLKERGIEKKIRLKAAITGPFTLASYIETKTGTFPSNTALSNRELVEQLAQVVSKSCNAAAKEANMISIDEPILGVIIGARMPPGYREDDIISIYNQIKGNCKGKITGTHICGRLSPTLAKTLLRTELDFLSHEFYDSPRNIGLYEPKALEENGKALSIGCVSSKNPNIESPQEILQFMEKFRDYGDNLVFTPDCGFKNLIVDGSHEEGYKISIKKLRNMVEAAEKFRVMKKATDSS